MSPPNLWDIAESLKGQVSVTPEEHTDERALRIATAHRQSVIEDWKGIVVFAVLLLSILLIGMLAADVGIFQRDAQPDTKKWAQTVLTIVLSGGVSFVVGRKTAGK